MLQREISHNNLPLISLHIHPHNKSRESMDDDIRHDSRYSILMLPWLAHGHISPFLELAKKLTKRNFYIYFCSTPVNLTSIKNKITHKHSFSIQLVELDVPSLPDLPPHYHTTNGLPPHLMPTLKKAFDMSSSNFSNILETLNPDLLIYDFLQPWAPAIASSRNIPAIEFLSAGAAMSCYLNHPLKNPPGVKFPFPEIFIHDYEKTKFTLLKESTANGVKDLDRVTECASRSSGIILIKTFREIEGKYIDYLSILYDKKVVPVGPLVEDLSVDDYNIEDQEDQEEREIIEWLDKKDKSSVVFVSFGSEYFLSPEEIEEIAHGLELSKVNFIWVIRFPVGGDRKIRVEEALPQGFLERVKERGMVLKDWAPQVKILGHTSTGGFASHCGWSSVMEGIKFGVPIIAMPMHLDQPFNARVVVEVGVGMDVNRCSSGGVLVREEVAKVIRKVMVEKSGVEIRKRARELSENMGEKGDHEEIDEVVKELLLLQLCKNKLGSNGI